jgi:hypothetical protein
MGRKAMQRLLGIVHMNPEVDPKTWDHTEEDIYGLGGVRKVEKFYETFGIDVKKKTIEAHMCSFVDGKAETSMHRMFHPHMREDGMGVDYAKIRYKFVDPQKIEKLRAEQRVRIEKERAAGQILLRGKGTGGEAAADREKVDDDKDEGTTTADEEEANEEAEGGGDDTVEGEELEEE